MPNIVQLSDVRRHLRFPNPDNPSSEDSTLQMLMNAADDVISYHCDEILSSLHDEYYDGTGNLLYLRHRPLLAVMSVIGSYGPYSVEFQFQQPDTGPVVFGSGTENTAQGAANVWAYSIDDYEEALLSCRTVANQLMNWPAGRRNIHVVYRTGLSEIPGAIVFADLSLIAHWYQNEELRSVTQGGSNIAYDVVNQEISVARHDGSYTSVAGVPNRILELITAHKRGPIIA